AKPPGETPQGGQAPIVGGRRKRFLAREKCLDHVSRERGDGQLAALRQQRRQVFRVTFAGAPRERGDLEKLLERTRQGQRWGSGRRFHTLLHLMRNIVYTFVEVQCSVLFGRWQDIAPNGLLGAIPAKAGSDGCVMSLSVRAERATALARFAFPHLLGISYLHDIAGQMRRSW